MSRIESIDAIARHLQRDVLMLVFCHGRAIVSLRSEAMQLPWETDPARARLLAWLEQEGIAWQCCLPFLLDGFHEVPYQGHIFIDIPIQPDDAHYQRLLARLNNTHEDGVEDGVGLFVMRHATALQNLRCE